MLDNDSFLVQMRLIRKSIRRRADFSYRLGQYQLHALYLDLLDAIDSYLNFVDFG